MSDFIKISESTTVRINLIQSITKGDLHIIVNLENDKTWKLYFSKSEERDKAFMDINNKLLGENSTNVLTEDGFDKVFWDMINAWNRDPHMLSADKLAMFKEKLGITRK